MKAMILAAGRGERLRPLTNMYPKALVPVVNRPVMDRIIHYLTTHGVEKIIINAHHHFKMIQDYITRDTYRGVTVDIKIEKVLLGTGGGIKNVRDFWGNDPFIVINGDILTDIDLGDMYGFHMRKGNLVTMALHDLPRYNKVIVDEGMNILSIGSKRDVTRALAFTGIHVINPEVLSFIPDNTKYNIINAYRRLIDYKKPIRGYMATDHRWIDIGTIPDYLKANCSYLPSGDTAIDQTCSIDSSAVLQDWAVIGKGSLIEQGAMVQRSVLWNDVIITKGVKVVDSVVASGVHLKNDLIAGVAVR